MKEDEQTNDRRVMAMATYSTTYCKEFPRRGREEPLNLSGFDRYCIVVDDGKAMALHGWRNGWLIRSLRHSHHHNNSPNLPVATIYGVARKESSKYEKTSSFNAGCLLSTMPVKSDSGRRKARIREYILYNADCSSKSVTTIVAPLRDARRDLTNNDETMHHSSICTSHLVSQTDRGDPTGD